MKLDVLFLMIKKIIRRIIFSSGSTNDSNLSPEQKAASIITTNQFMSLSTCDNNKPWVAPVWYAVDHMCNFYFASDVNSRHCSHIKNNSKVAIAIFDSTATPGFVDGLQIEGTATKVDDDRVHETGGFFWKKRWIGDDSKITEYTNSSENYKSDGIKKRKFYIVRIDNIYKVNESITDYDARIMLDISLLLKELSHI